MKQIYPHDYSPVLLLTILGPCRSIVCRVSASQNLEMLTVVNILNDYFNYTSRTESKE